MVACNFILLTKFRLHVVLGTYNIENWYYKVMQFKKKRHKTFITKLFQSVTEVYYKVCQVLQSALGITKCDRLLLQSVSDITKCERLLLQSASGIIKCDSYYKVRHHNS